MPRIGNTSACLHIINEGLDKDFFIVSNRPDDRNEVNKKKKSKYLISSVLQSKKSTDNNHSNVFIEIFQEDENNTNGLNKYNYTSNEGSDKERNGINHALVEGYQPYVKHLKGHSLKSKFSKNHFLTMKKEEKLPLKSSNLESNSSINPSTFSDQTIDNEINKNIHLNGPENYSHISNSNGDFAYSKVAKLLLELELINYEINELSKQQKVVQNDLIKVRANVSCANHDDSNTRNKNTYSSRSSSTSAEDTDSFEPKPLRIFERSRNSLVFDECDKELTCTLGKENNNTFKTFHSSLANQNSYQTSKEILGKKLTNEVLKETLDCSSEIDRKIPLLFSISNSQNDISSSSAEDNINSYCLRAEDRDKNISNRTSENYRLSHSDSSYIFSKDIKKDGKNKNNVESKITTHSATNALFNGKNRLSIALFENYNQKTSNGDNTSDSINNSKVNFDTNNNNDDQDTILLNDDLNSASPVEPHSPFYCTKNHNFINSCENNNCNISGRDYNYHIKGNSSTSFQENFRSLDRSHKKPKFFYIPNNNKTINYMDSNMEDQIRSITRNYINKKSSCGMNQFDNCSAGNKCVSDNNDCLGSTDLCRSDYTDKEIHLLSEDYSSHKGKLFKEDGSCHSPTKCYKFHKKNTLKLFESSQILKNEDKTTFAIGESHITITKPIFAKSTVLTTKGFSSKDILVTVIKHTKAESKKSKLNNDTFSYWDFFNKSNINTLSSDPLKYSHQIKDPGKVFFGNDAIIISKVVNNITELKVLSPSKKPVLTQNVKQKDLSEALNAQLIL